MRSLRIAFPGWEVFVWATVAFGSSFQFVIQIWEMPQWVTPTGAYHGTVACTRLAREGDSRMMKQAPLEHWMWGSHDGNCSHVTNVYFVLIVLPLSVKLTHYGFY